MNGKILVTGCSGLVGTHTANKLVEKGYEVVGVDIKTSEFLPKKNFELILMDLRDADDVSVLFDQFKFDGVINSFGIKGSPIRVQTKPIEYLEPSIKVNVNIIDNCVKHDCWLVYMSSVGVYEPAEVFIEDTVWSTFPSKKDWYGGWSKRIPELYLEAYKVQEGYDKYTIVRPANIFGEYDNFGEGSTAIASTIKKVFEATNEIVSWGDGSPTRDFIYGGDVADASIKCFEERLHITSNLGSGEEISIKEMIQTVIEVSGKDIKINWDSSKPNGDARRLMSTDIQKQFGLLPKLGFKEGIKNTYNFYSESIS